MKKVFQFFAIALFSSIMATTLPVHAADAPLSAEQAEAVRVLIRETLQKNPEIVMEAIRTFQVEQAKAEKEANKHVLARSQEQLLNDPTSPILGNPEGDVSLVEFFDYRCGYCKRVFPSVMKLLKDDGNIRYVIKEFPILGPDSEFASRAALAAQEQGKYLELHVALMKTPGALSKDKVLGIAKSIGLDMDKLKKDLGSEKVNKALANNFSLAQSLGISGTPAFVIGGELAPGAIGIERMADMIKKARDEKKKG